MTIMLRRSPVSFPAKPAEKIGRDGWEVALRYENEASDLQLTDLSHLPKWDIQDADLSSVRPADMTLPENPGDCVLQNHILLNRLTHTRAVVWHLSGEAPPLPSDNAYTDITDASALFAVIGKDVFRFMEKITALDVCPDARKLPFALQGPLLHVPCHIAVCQISDGFSCIFISCSRSCGQSMADGLLKAGRDQNIRPAGESAFRCAVL